MKRILPVLLLACVVGPLLVACGDATREHAAPHAHAPHATDEPEKGPHRGRLLRDGAFVVELAIFEDGVPPEYRAWITRDGKPVPPDQVELVVELARLDGEKNRFAFAPQEDFLRGDGVVTEPHSFDVTVIARHAGVSHQWSYASYEGRVSIAADSARAAGIETAKAGPRRIHELLPLYGRIALEPDAVRAVGARYPGTIRSVARSVGDTVRAGEVLAQVESNDSLQVYAVIAPIAGTITARKANPGEQAGSEPLFTIGNLDRPWAELSVFPRDIGRVQPGQDVRVQTLDGERSIKATVARIAADGSGAGGALRVWARLATPDRTWTPGLPVSAQVQVGGAEVPLAVEAAALQAFRDFTVVFAKVGDTYEVRMLELGRSDGEYVEVLGGLKPGTEYVSTNSYLIKADIEKSGASHDH